MSYLQRRESRKEKKKGNTGERGGGEYQERKERKNTNNIYNNYNTQAQPNNSNQSYNEEKKLSYFLHSIVFPFFWSCSSENPISSCENPFIVRAYSK